MKLVKDFLKKVAEKVKEKVVKHPLISVGISAGAGFVLAEIAHYIFAIWLASCHSDFSTLASSNRWCSSIHVFLHRSGKGGKGSHSEVWRQLQTLSGKGAETEFLAGDY